MFNKNNKKMLLYVVSLRSNPSKFLSFTVTKKQAIEYGNSFLKLTHLDHFTSWCELKELNPDLEDSWNIYYLECISKEEKQDVVIHKIYYKWNDIVAIMRMFGGCVPLGNSFNTQSEYSYLNFKLETQKKLTETLKDQLEKIMQQEDYEKTEESEEPDA